jgi:alpha-maltose-1-phosphate synthase
MRLCYVLLSPTFGMHQYTADLANRMTHDTRDPAADGFHDVHLVTTDNYPRDRYALSIAVHTPLTTRNTGLSLDALQMQSIRRVLREITDLRPDVVHITGPHIWNLFLLRGLAAAHIPVIHTLHDLDPHVGTRSGFLLKPWNQTIIRNAGHILVHGQIYRERLIAAGLPRDRVTATPLLHLFLGSEASRRLSVSAEDVEYQPWALFFGRVERYKGLDCLLTASDMLDDAGANSPKVVIAGLGDLSGVWAGPLPKFVEVRNRRISDAEALDLFRKCGLLVLPYVNATQSALIAAAYYFRKPVLVTRTGALSEYVEDGRTGCVVEPDHPATLARCLSEMLNDPTGLAQKGAAGRGWYESRRTLEEQTLRAMYLRVKESCG